jgi:F-type H+-transporting ATPase subunit delta
MEESGTIARPYALAAFEQAQEDGQVAEWAGMLESLEIIASDPTVKGLIANPKVDREAVAALVLDVAGDRLSPHGRNFVRLLGHNGRLDQLAAIRGIFEQEREALEGRGKIEVRSAYPLTPEEEGRIGEAMSKRLGVSVSLSVSVDPDLIGGVVVRAGDLVIDASLRGRLNQLRQALA